MFQSVSCEVICFLASERIITKFLLKRNLCTHFTLATSSTHSIHCSTIIAYYYVIACNYTDFFGHTQTSSQRRPTSQKVKPSCDLRVFFLAAGIKPNTFRSPRFSLRTVQLISCVVISSTNGPSVEEHTHTHTLCCHGDGTVSQ